KRDPAYRPGWPDLQVRLAVHAGGRQVLSNAVKRRPGPEAPPKSNGSQSAATVRWAVAAFSRVSGSDNLGPGLAAFQQGAGARTGIAAHPTRGNAPFLFYPTIRRGDIILDIPK